MANLDYSDPVEVTDGGKIIQVKDLVEEADHSVYIHHTGAPLSATHPYFRVKLVQQGNYVYFYFKNQPKDKCVRIYSCVN